MTPLRQARQRRKLTQVQLAALSGLSQKAISDLECGDVRHPSWETVAKLSTALGVKPERLFPVELAATGS